MSTQPPPTASSSPTTRQTAVGPSSRSPQFDIITDSDGIDRNELWSESFEGKSYGIAISIIHLSTEKVDVGPPLHQHPYVETEMIRQGRALFTVGTEQFVGRAGQTVVTPPNTPHTFRTHGPARYESIAVHLSPAFITELLEADTELMSAGNRRQIRHSVA